MENRVPVPRPQRKRIRLDSASYAVPGTVWLVTTNTAHRISAFRDPEMAAVVVGALRRKCEEAGADLLVYCVMPDHLHFLVAVTGTDLVTIVQGVKSYTGHVWKRRTGKTPLWQASFHDHGIRQTENMDDVVRYVIENPQRAGLVSDWLEYPWIGGSLIEESPSG